MRSVYDLSRDKCVTERRITVTDDIIFMFQDGTNGQTTSLLGLLGSWTTQQATTDIDLLAETTEATVQTTVPPLPVFTTEAASE